MNWFGSMCSECFLGPKPRLLELEDLEVGGSQAGPAQEAGDSP